LIHGGEFRLAPFYSDNMVVQRDKPVLLLGSAGSGDRIAAEFAGSKAEALADAKGVFKLKLPARKTDKQGRVVTVKCGGKTIELKDVLVGDVWLCSGQSNMEFDMGRLNIADEAKSENRPLIRRIKFKETFQPFPADPMQVVVTGAWQTGTPQTIVNWSATGYYFARRIQDRNPDLPIGLYECAYSGSPIECWLPMETWAEFPAFKEGAQVANRRQDPGLTDPANREAWRRPSGMYNAMLQCLTATPLAGAIWYQGEGKAPTQEIKGGKLGGFAVGNKDGKWAWADAVIDGQTVVVSSNEIAGTVAVRYALSNSPGNANLYNQAGLPASPFTTEK
jgi:sialate O-acetylesterase